MPNNTHANSNKNELAFPQKTGISSSTGTQQPSPATRPEGSQQVSNSHKAGRPQRKTNLKQVSIALIWPNPDNPRSWNDPEAIKELASNMKAVGQRTPVKLVLLTEAEKTTIATTEGSCPYEYKLLGGHLRRKAALSLGWDTLDALILDLTPDEAELEMIWDNNITELHWLDRFKIIERQKKKKPNIRQEAIAARVGLDQTTISRALKTIQYLNEGSRKLIYASRIKMGGSTEAGMTLTITIAALEDPDSVEKTLKVAFGRQMTVPQAQKLVEWVSKGNSPDSYPESGKSGKVKSEKGVAKAKTPTLTPEVADKLVEMAKKAGVEESQGSKETTHRDALEAYRKQISEGAHSTSSGQVRSEKLGGSEPTQLDQMIPQTTGQRIGYVLGAIIASIIDRVIAWGQTKTDKPVRSSKLESGEFSGKASATSQPVSSTHPSDEILHEFWEEVKTAWLVDEPKTPFEKTVWTVSGIFSIFILVGIGWLGWKTIAWVIHLI
jgi:ParB family chromosome partitioning protein